MDQDWVTTLETAIGAELDEFAWRYVNLHREHAETDQALRNRCREEARRVLQAMLPSLRIAEVSPK